MKRLLLVLVLTYGAGTIVKAQNNMAFPSANNSFLGIIGGAATSTGIGADLYTGSAQVNVPICKLSAKEMSIPISLSYSGGRGIRVQDYATCAGLGWQLNAGGGLSRVVRGFPDERPNGFLGTGLWGQHIASWKNNGTGLSSQITGINGTSLSTPTADGEPDIYFVRTPYFSVQFVFDEYGVPVFSNSTGIKITAYNFYNSSNYTNSRFVVTDDQGTQFFFGSTSQSVEQTTATLFGTSYTFPTTWYLDKIVTFNAKETINLNYTNASGNDVMTHYQWTKTYYYTGCTSENNTPYTSTINQPRHVSSIVSANGRAEFSYAFDRRDLVNAARLTNITLKSVNGSTVTTLQGYDFSYTYFGDPTTNTTLLRLKLDKVTVTGGTPVTAAPVDLKVFTYNTSENLPARNAASFDYWGYYTLFTPINGSTDPMVYPQLREPNVNRTKANILTKVKDITGMTWELDYEQNTYFKTTTSANVNVGGLRIKTISQTLPSGELIQSAYNYNAANGNSNGQIISASYNNLVNSWGGVVSQVLSESPSNIYDVNGVFIGYSSVKITGQNGGYTVSAFSSFSDFQDDINYVNGYDPNAIPNISSSTSKSYKRGLLKTQAAYTSAGNKITEDVYTYTSLTLPETKKAWGYHSYNASYNVCGASGFNIFSSTFRTDVENYRMTRVVHRDYAQNNPAAYVENTTDFTYATNKRLLRTISNNSSKNTPQSKTFYYPDDMDLSGNGIPMLTGIDQTAISNLVNQNRTNVIIHETDSKNGVITQVHNTYTAFAMGAVNSVYLTATAAYKGSTLANQQFFNYDLSTSNLLSTYEANGKTSSFMYGYNSAYPIAKVINASSTSGVTLQPYSSYGGYVNLYGPTNTSFSSTIAGDIKLQIGFGSYPGSTNITNINYTLTGPANRSGSLCYTMTGTGCSMPNNITFANMPAGTYSLTISGSTNYPSSNPNISYYYATSIPQFTYAKEFYYEDFEQGAANVNGGAHTGKGYYSGNYTVNWALPNARSYIMQWWRLTGGVWVFNEAPYTASVSLIGPVDDIRIFPADAQMTTFTHEPLVGKTGETDVAGRSTTYEYDGFSRQNITRDNDKNIVKKTCYNFAGQTVGCKLFTNTPQSGGFTRNNCPTGTGTTVTYTVPANKYYSDISQADANQQAVNDVNANGQAYANANGLCNSLVTVMGSNTTSTAFYVTFTNSYNSSLVYNKYISSSVSNYIVADLPLGTYNVTIGPIFNTSYSYNYNVNGSVQSGVGVKNWYYISMNCSSCGTIQIY